MRRIARATFLIAALAAGGLFAEVAARLIGGAGFCSAAPFMLAGFALIVYAAVVGARTNPVP